MEDKKAKQSKEDAKENKKLQEKKKKKVTLSEMFKVIKKVLKKEEPIMSEDKDVLKATKLFCSKALAWCIFTGVMFTILDTSVTYYRENNMEQVTFEEYEEYLANGDIDTVYYSTSSEKMRFTLYTVESKAMEYEDRLEYTYGTTQWRKVTYPAEIDFRLHLLEKGVEVKLYNETPVSLRLWIALLGLLGTLFSLVFMVFFCIYISQAMGKKQVVNDYAQETGITFKDVIGHEEIKKDLQFYVDLIKRKKEEKVKDTKLLVSKTQETDKKVIEAKIPHGCLFTGPPGTGKTLLAKAIAGEAQVPFFYANASNFVEMFVGLGAKRVRELFEKARQQAPCIVFLDEIDAIGTSRTGNSNSSIEHSQTLNALLQALDGFDTKNDIFVIGATNLPDKLDSALKRAGRFDRQVAINPPQTIQERQNLFDFYLKDKPLAEDLDTHILAKQSTGMTGADIAAIVNEACLIATAKGVEELTKNILEESLDKQLLRGNRKKNTNDKIKQVVAYHESGHAVVNYLLGLPMARVSIVGSTSGVGGMVVTEDADEDLMLSKSSIKEKVCVLYGGRCSEYIKFGADNVTVGASNDIEKATKYIRAYVDECGFTGKTGLLNLSILQENQLPDRSITLKEMQNLATDLEEKTIKMLMENYHLVENLVKVLMEYETVSGEDIIKAIETGSI